MAKWNADAYDNWKTTDPREEEEEKDDDDFQEPDDYYDDECNCHDCNDH